MPAFRSLALLAVLALTSLSAANAQQLTPADSSLVRRILHAEDARDSTSPALADGRAHPDPRIRALAQRATWRIRDTLFAARDSLPAPAPAPAWPEPAWKPRYRAVVATRDDCSALRRALADSAWPVRLRALDVARATCAQDDSLGRAMRAWIDALPGDASRRGAGFVSWHAAAHSLVALARLRPVDARGRIRRLATHAQWQVRAYTARAAAVVADTATLRTLARDPDDNVKEAAIEALSKLTGHADDAVYLAALNANGAQAVRAAAGALKGSARPDVLPALQAAYEQWVRRANASERDARIALLEAAGRPAADDKPVQASLVSTAEADSSAELVRLALGDDVRLRVTMSRTTAGGSFVVRLRGDLAPITAARVLALAKSGYYDGTEWQRVENDFVIQGLGHGANEYVGHRSYLRDELANLAHPRGTVGMSTRAHDTGDAQWFVNLRDNPRLVRDYTVFAEVVDGMDVVDGILEGDVVQSVRVVTPR